MIIMILTSSTAFADWHLCGVSLIMSLPVVLHDSAIPQVSQIVRDKVAKNQTGRSDLLCRVVTGGTLPFQFTSNALKGKEHLG